MIPLSTTPSRQGVDGPGGRPHHAAVLQSSPRPPRRWPGIVVAAHWPVTAVGVEVEVVGKRLGSFEGVLEAVAKCLGCEEVAL